MIDTHTHLYMPDTYPGKEADEAVTRAINAGVHTMIMPNVDLDSITPIKSLRERFPNNIYIAMGLHPTEVTPQWKEHLTEIETHLTDEGVIALGEIGMDLYHDDTMQTEQEEAFVEQLGWAQQHRLPVIIHQRAALAPLLKIISDTPTDNIPGFVFHCFTEGTESVREIRKVLPQAYFGIGGVCTFKNAPALRQALHEIGIDKILLETDAPYLAPMPHRGTRNESSYIPIIAASIANELGLPLPDLEKATDDNARKLFSLPA